MDNFIHSIIIDSLFAAEHKDQYLHLDEMLH
jgi:hypothetical protein